MDSRLRSHPRAGFTTIELLVAATIGLILTGAALALCRTGNLAVASLTRSQAAWQESRAAATLWASEWRGAGYDPTGVSGAGIGRLRSDTLEFTADWNGDGALVPTGSNPNERLAYAAVPGAWRRGVNGGPRLPVAWPDSISFAYRDEVGTELGPAPIPAAVRVVEARLVLAAGGTGRTLAIVWAVARRNP